MSYVLGFDPAAEKSVSHTGVALIYYEDNNDPPKLVSGFTVPGGFRGFCDSFEDATSELNILLKGLLGVPDVVTVCEGYVPYNAAADPTPLLLEGLIRFLIPETILQPSSVMKYVSDQRLKDAGMYSTDGHHRDVNSAVKHALAYLRSIRHGGTLKLLSDN